MSFLVFQLISLSMTKGKRVGGGKAFKFKRKCFLSSVLQKDTHTTTQDKVGHKGFKKKANGKPKSNSHLYFMDMATMKNSQKNSDKANSTKETFQNSTRNHPSIHL